MRKSKLISSCKDLSGVIYAEIWSLDTGGFAVWSKHINPDFDKLFSLEASKRAWKLFHDYCKYGTNESKSQ